MSSEGLSPALMKQYFLLISLLKLCQYSNSQFCLLRLHGLIVLQPSSIENVEEKVCLIEFVR